jgi:hypothetical protein
VPWSLGDAKSYRYYIPAFMCFDLRNPEFDAASTPFMEFALEKAEDLGWGILSAVQISAVLRFLECHASAPVPTAEVMAAHRKWKVKANTAPHAVAAKRGLA